MKSYKLKPLLIAACCAATALWTEIQGMEERRDEPAGIINAFAGEIAPNGWLLCNGRECSSSEYPELYRAIETKFVPDHEELRILRHNAARENINNRLFYVPDLRGRVIVGVDGGAGRVTFGSNTLGGNGGEERHQLTIAELANHPHKMFDAITGSRALPTTAVLSGTNPNMACFGFTESEGGDQPHNNMQPYTCLNYIINTGLGNEPQQNEIVQLKERIERLEASLEGLKKCPPPYHLDNLLGTH